MAQVPWRVLSRQPIEAAAAARQLRVCYRNIRKACAAAEGGSTASALLQQESLRSLKSAHAALTEVVHAEGDDRNNDGAENKNACFELVTVRGTAILPPCFWQVARLGVYRHLMGFLFKFVPELDGVWLAFSEIRPASVALDSSSSSSSRSSKCMQGKGALGFLLPDLDSNDGALFVSVETKALVFCPKVGDLITCKTQTVRPAVVRLLWLGHFTAVINREHVAGRFRYEEDAKVYAHRKDKARRIEEKGFVRIHIIDIPKSHSGDRVAVRGSVLARGSGPLAAVAAEAAAHTATATAGEASGKRKALPSTEAEGTPTSHKRQEFSVAAAAATEERQHRGHRRE